MVSKIVLYPLAGCYVSMDVLGYYSRRDVAEEIARYCRGRWIALAGGSFFRYMGSVPLRISGPDDVSYLIRRFSFSKARTIYATANIYRTLATKKSVDDPKNVAYSTPVWDIDNELDEWKLTLEVARVIVEELEREGVSSSVYLKWSGRGCHVHLHERAFSKDLLKEKHPLDVAYSVVEYVLRKCKDRIAEIIKRSKSMERPLAVENEMDFKRVFTAPLSLHKTLDVVAVCFRPDEIDKFSPDWIKPEGLRHNRDWDRYVEGEADELGRKALDEVGGYFGREVVRSRVGQAAERKTVAATTPAKISSGKVGRFQVMALLQAARYYLLTGDLERAKSFGLNRAIFYAWAKRRGRAVGVRAAGASLKVSVPKKALKEERVGDEVAFVSQDGYFTMGDQVQKPEDYDRQIARRIDAVVPYEKAWDAALRYLSSFPRSVLESQRKFFEEVYKPVRDNFLEVIRRYH